MSAVSLSDRDGEVFDLSFLKPRTFAIDQRKRFLDAQYDSDRVKVQALTRVPGASLISGLLSQQECTRLVEIAEEIGWMKTCGIGPAAGKDGKSAPSKCVLQVSVPETLELSNRVIGKVDFSSFCPDRLVGINSRFRMHKYEAGFALGPHYDRGEYSGTAVDDDGELRFDYFGDGRTSRMSLLIYLNQDCEGGATNFLKDDEIFESVLPVPGDAVCFFHGSHHLSPLHEGALVRDGVKYIVRTDFLFVEE